MKRAILALVRWLKTTWTFLRGGTGLWRVASVAVRVEQALYDAGERRLAAPLTRLRPSLLESRLRVAVFGEFNRGKSTLLNALLGRVVLPAKLVPTTGHTIRLVEGADEEVSVWFRRGGLARYPLEDLDGVSSLGFNGRAREDIETVEVAAAADLLRGGLVLLDTPGCNEVESQTARARRAVTAADLILFVIDAQKLLSDAEQRSARWLVEKLGKPVVVVVNFMNRLDEPDQQQARRRLDQWCRTCVPEELGRPWFEVNALGALKYALGSAPPPVDHFWGLRHALMRLRGRRRRQLQSRSRGCWLVVVLKALRQVHAQAARSLRQQAQRRKREQEDLCQRLRTSRRRRKTDVRTHRQHLLACAERTLGDSLEALLSRFARKPRAVLEQAAGSWYEDALLQAIATLERQANDTLTALAAEDKCPLEAVALAHQVDTRFQITPLSSFSRDVFGDSLGDWVEGRMGLGPDYAAVYGRQVSQKWAKVVRGALTGLRSLYDDACTLLLEQLDRQLQLCRRGDPQQAAMLRRQEDVEAILEWAVEKLSSC